MVFSVVILMLILYHLDSQERFHHYWSQATNISVFV